MPHKQMVLKVAVLWSPVREAVLRNS